MLIFVSWHMRLCVERPKVHEKKNTPSRKAKKADSTNTNAKHILKSADFSQESQLFFVVLFCLFYRRNHSSSI